MSININSMLSLTKQRKTISLPFEGRETYSTLFRNRQYKNSIQEIELSRL